MKMRDGISEYKGAILVDEEMPNVIAKQASDIRVWDTYSLDKLSKNKTLRKDVEKLIKKKCSTSLRGYIYKKFMFIATGRR